MGRAARRFWWNLVGVCLMAAGAAGLLLDEATPKADCIAFSGTKTRTHRGGRRGTTYTFIRTDCEELRVRSIHHGINGALIRAPVGARLTGLLDEWGHAVSLSMNGEVVAAYEDSVRADRTAKRWFGLVCVVMATWCLFDAVRAWRSGARPGGTP